MIEKLSNQKYTTENIPGNIATIAHKYLGALADGSSNEEEVNWLIDNLEPKTIKDLSRLREHLSEINVLEEIIKRKSLPPHYFG